MIIRSPVSILGHLEFEPVSGRKKEFVLAGHELKTPVALHHAGQEGEVTRPDVEILVELPSVLQLAVVVMPQMPAMPSVIRRLVLVVLLLVAVRCIDGDA